MERQTRNHHHGIIKGIAIGISCLLVIVLTAFLIIVPPSNGTIQEYKDEKGNMLKNSLVEKGSIKIDDCNIGTYILSKDVSNPVLLVCGGGPGISQWLVEELKPSVLPDYFTVCYFDYRGTGRTYNSKIKAEDMTLERYLDDTTKITEYLLNRFNKKKVYIMGHSFGTSIALRMVKNHPEYYYAYFAQSQIADQHRSEELVFDYMKEEYRKLGNTKMYNQFNELNIKDTSDDWNKYFSKFRDEAMHDLGVGTFKDMKSVISGLFFPSLKVKSWTIGERISLWKGKALSNEFPVTKMTFNTKIMDEITSIDVPIYFFTGKYDWTCLESIQKEYYELISAPEKKYYYFENSAHSPIYEEKDRTNQILSSMGLIKN